MSSEQSSPPAGLRLAWTVFAALLLFGLCYRLRLAVFVEQTQAFLGEVPAPLRALLRQSAADMMFGLFVAGISLIFSQGAAAFFERVWRPQPARRKQLQRFFELLLGVLFLGIGLLCQAHFGTFIATGTGLSAQLLEESMSASALKELFFLLLPSEVAFILLPLGLFVGVSLLWKRPLLRRFVKGGSTLLAVALIGLAMIVPAPPLPDSLMQHPIGFIVTDLVRSRQSLELLPGGFLTQAGAGPIPSQNPLGNAFDEPEKTSAALSIARGAAPPTMALLGADFAYSEAERPVHKILPSASKDGALPYNILFVLMESTGLDYALRPLDGATGSTQVAMPFLRSIGEKGYLLSNHFSSGNSSPRGIFSLLSGLYVMPEVSIFDVRKDVYLPSLATFLDESYHRFLVTPASLDWYFPHSFLLHSGLRELWGYSALPVHKNAPGGRSHARDEAETVGFFLRRLDEHVQSGAPFLGIYYSFIAHWPYPDYGPSTHVVNPTHHMGAYYNDLRYLDTQIQRIFSHLQERQLLDRTIVVLVGDHGEAFGQHPSNYTHSRMSFNENLKTPAILYQPRLFPPRVFSAPTSHVDILPTLLDAMGIKYDAALLQGESLFQDQFHRRYIFSYGNEDTLTSVSSDLIKLQVSLRDGSCWVYNLKTDLAERHRLSCQPYRNQQQALLLYRRHQQTGLRRYNQISQQSAPLAASR